LNGALLIGTGGPACKNVCVGHLEHTHYTVIGNAGAFGGANVEPAIELE
jgi:hypothetical protein